MTTTIKLITIALALCLNVGSAAAAKPSLRDVPAINDGLFHVAVANVIRKGCSSIDARFFKAISTLREIKSQAIALGYTQQEIDAFVESDVEKDRMRARGAKLFQARGVDPNNPDDLCRMGREEIAKNSPVGVLLKAK
ncbi:MAG: DUF5333 domain-containing protein [Aestuariivita sp.]|uniref:DUF5333 domain-containing protein n=1 Tax=Aestuariivita sp. TaxID=1872407 RepID=UPI003BB10C73